MFELEFIIVSITACLFTYIRVLSITINLFQINKKSYFLATACAQLSIQETVLKLCDTHTNNNHPELEKR